MSRDKYVAVTKLLSATRGVRRVALQEGEFTFEIKAGFVNWGKAKRQPERRP